MLHLSAAVERGRRAAPMWRIEVMKKDERHFSPKRIEEAAQTADVISRARAAAGVDQSRDRLDDILPRGHHVALGMAGHL